MASAASLRRKFAPKANTQVEVSTDPKPSIWTRIKTTAKRLVGATKRGIVTAAKTVARPFKAAARFVARKTLTVRFAIAMFVRRLWTRALQPFLGGVTLGLTLFAFLYAPVLFIAALVVGGLLFLALAKGVEALDQRAADSRLARFALMVIEVLGYTAIILEYLAAAFIAGVLCAASLPFAVFMGMYLVLKYIGNRHALLASTLTFCLLAGLLAPVLLWLVWRMYLAAVSSSQTSTTPTPPPVRENAPSVDADIVVVPTDITPSMAPDAPETWHRGNFLRAQGTEELWGTEHDVAPTTFLVHDDADEGQAVPVNTPCVSCGTTDGALRAAAGDPVDLRGLCTTCFDVECEVDAIDRTGVSLTKRNIAYSLNDVGLRATPEYAASVFDADRWYWVRTEWFRDRVGINHERTWTVLAEGKPHGAVTYMHAQKGMYGYDAANRPICVVRVRRGQKAYQEALAAAKAQVTDELNKRADRQPAATEIAPPTLASLPSTGR